MEPIDLSTVERMVALVREIAEFGRAAIDAGGIITEARAIAALLPPPVDPDLVTAREIAAEISAYWFRQLGHSKEDQRFVLLRYLSGDWDEGEDYGIETGRSVGKIHSALRKAREEGVRR